MTDQTWIDRVIKTSNNLIGDEKLDYLVVCAQRHMPGGPNESMLHIYGPEALSQRDILRSTIAALHHELEAITSETEFPEVVWSRYEDIGTATEYYAYVGNYRLSVREQGNAWVWTLKNRDTSEEISGFKGTADDAKAEALLRAYGV
jgi:hypothetical protein